MPSNSVRSPFSAARAQPDLPFTGFFGGGITLAMDTGGKVIDASQIIDDGDAGWTYQPDSGGLVWDRGQHHISLHKNTG
jgi:hypothetical protein